MLGLPTTMGRWLGLPETSSPTMVSVMLGQDVQSTLQIRVKQDAFQFLCRWGVNAVHELENLLTMSNCVDDMCQRRIQVVVSSWVCWRVVNAEIVKSCELIWSRHW